FFFPLSVAHRVFPLFPTRRSSDLACGHVLGLGDVGVVLDRYVVVVVEDDEVAELLVARQRGDLVADAFLDISVGDEAVHVVVERARAGRGVRVEQAALAAGGPRPADPAARGLAAPPRGGLPARGGGAP